MCAWTVGWSIEVHGFLVWFEIENTTPNLVVFFSIIEGCNLNFKTKYELGNDSHGLLPRRNF